MARQQFEIQAARRRPGDIANGAIYVVYSDVAGTIPADISATVDGASITGSVITTTDIPGLGPGSVLFYGPSSGVDTLYIRSSSDATLGVQKLRATPDPRLDALELHTLDWINVQDFAELVTGDDWTAAFQAAFAATVVLGATSVVGVCPTVYVPWKASGYNISSTLSWSHFDLVGDRDRATIINWTGAAGGICISAPSLVHQKMKGIHFRTGDVGVWLDVPGVTDWGGQLENVSFNMRTGHSGIACVRLGRVVNAHWRDMRFDYQDGYAIIINHGPTSPGCSFALTGFTCDTFSGNSSVNGFLKYKPVDSLSSLTISLRDARVETSANTHAANGSLITVDCAVAGLNPGSIHIENIGCDFGTMSSGPLSAVYLENGGAGIAPRVTIVNSGFGNFTNILGGTWPTNFPIPVMPTQGAVQLFTSGRQSSGAANTNVVQFQRAFASDGFVHKTKAGTPVDADFYQAPPDGTVAVDTTNNRFYFRSGGVWRRVDTGALSATLADVKGDLFVATAADVVARLAVGADGQFLEADSTQTAGVKWANPGIGGTNTFAKPGIWNVYPTTTAVVMPAADIFRGSIAIVSVKTTISKARIRVSAASGNIAVAVYTADGATRLLTTGAVACPVIGKADLAFTGSLDLDPGAYFVGWSADNTTAALHGIANGAQAFAGGQTGGASHPPPATVTVDDDSTGSVPSIGLW